MSVPAFIDLEANDQVAELRRYLKSKGADISEEPTSDDFIINVQQLVQGAEILWSACDNEADIESVYNSITSLLMLIPIDKSETIVDDLCDKLCKAEVGEKSEKKNHAKLKILNNLFNGIDERSSVRFVVYAALVKLAKKAEIVHLMNPDIDQIKKWVSQWDVSTIKVQSLLRNLYEAFANAKQSEKATRAMMELLGTYTEDNASQARDDAHRCIVTYLADPNSYVMDHLLALKPVKILEGELVHDLLNIFVSGKLHHYMQFYEANKDFVTSLGLSHEQNLQKMRVLTFMLLAETSKEIDYNTIQSEMNINEDEVESFVIDILRSQAVRVKIDQMSRKVIVSSTTHRTFGRQQWQLLRENLVEWRVNLAQIMGSLASLPSLQ